MSAPHRARKRFGQHFLVDAAVLDAIARAVDPKPGDALVEIGPGLGAMTQVLLERVPALTVIEIDRDLASRLRSDARLRVIEADVLNVDFALLDAGTATGPWRVVGNLPYNISSPILFHLLRFAPSVVDQHVMLQREVVRRMVAPADGADYGRLSVMLQWRYEMEHLLDVPPEAFDPPPQVQSAVVRMVPRPASELGGVSASALEDLMRASFAQRRKLLRHSLGAWLEQQGYAGNFNLQRRAQEVSVGEYVELARALAAQPKAGAS